MDGYLSRCSLGMMNKHYEAVMNYRNIELLGIYVIPKVYHDLRYKGRSKISGKIC